MSSRSSGVTNVRFSRWMISCVRKSHLCSTSLISSALSQIGSLGREHLLEQPRAALQLVGQRLEVGVELLFARNQSERHQRQPRSRSADASQNPRIVADPFTRLLHAVAHAVYAFAYAMRREQRSPRAHPRRRPGHAAVSADPAPLEAGGADRRQVPPDRHPDQQLPARRHPAHLRADAVQLGVAQPAHRADLPDGSVQPRVRRDPRGRADARQPELVSRARPTPCGRRRGISSATTPTTT